MKIQIFVDEKQVIKFAWPNYQFDLSIQLSAIPAKLVQYSISKLM